MPSRALRRRSATSLRLRLDPIAGAYSLTGNPVTEGISQPAAAGSYTLTGSASFTSLVMLAGPGSYGVTLLRTPLTRTGGDFDQVYGGIGHYLEEIERARQLAKITRKTPAPIVHEIRPRFRPIQEPAPQPLQQVPDPQSLIARRQEAEAQQRQAAIAKRRRQAAEILLLAS